MRYKDGEAPDPSLPYSESMHNMLSLSMYMGIVFGVVLFILGRHGDILWLKVWSIILVLLSVGYLVADALNLFGL